MVPPITSDGEEKEQVGIIFVYKIEKKRLV
jgi:hypothetical protein